MKIKNLLDLFASNFTINSPNIKPLIICILLLPLALQLTCTNPADSSKAVVTMKDSFTSFANTNVNAVAPGPVSGGLYYQYNICCSSSSVIRKINADNTLAWMNSYQISAVPQSLTTDLNEQNVYFYKNAYNMEVFKLNAATGVLSNVYFFSNVYGYINNAKPLILTDNSGFYTVSQDFSSNSMMCKYIFLTSGSANCYYISSIISSPYSRLLITNSQVFIIGSSYSSYKVYFMKITFGSSTTNWTKRIDCSFSYCYIGSSQSILSIDSTQIYSFYSYYDSTNYYSTCYMSLTISTGSVVGSRFKAVGNGCYGTYGISQSGDYVVTSLYCSSTRFLLLMNTLSSSFTLMSFNGSSINDLTTEPVTGRIVVVGSTLNSQVGYISKFLINSISALSDFSESSTFTMSLLSSGTDTLVSDSSVSLTPASASSISLPSYTSQSVIYVSGTSFNVYFQFETQSFSVMDNRVTKLTPDLSCSGLSSTQMIYGIADYNGVTAPSWVSMSSDGSLTASAPTISADTEFDFYINTAVVGSPNQSNKIIQLTVIKCLATNCQVCSSLNSSTCETCNSGYNLSSGTCALTQTNGTSQSGTLMPSLADFLISIMKGFAALALIVVIASKIVSSSPMTSLWQLLSQMQIFFILILIRAYLSIDVLSLVTWQRFALNLPNLIPFTKINFVNTIVNKFYYSLSNSFLSPAGINSDSTIYNASCFFIVMIFISFFYICITIISKLFGSESTSDGRCSKISNPLKWIVNKIYQFMTFALFIRILWLMALFLLISSINEMIEFKILDGTRISSLITALCIFIMYIAFAIVTTGLAFSSYTVEENEHNKLGELFSSIKMDKKSKLYAALDIWRKIIFAVLLISLSGISSRIVIGTVIFIQSIYLIYGIIVRPYNSFYLNVIEIINQVFFLVLLVLIEFTIICVLASSLIITSLIIIIEVLVKMFSWFQKKKSKPNIVTPVTNASITLSPSRRMKTHEETKRELKPDVLPIFGVDEMSVPRKDMFYRPKVKKSFNHPIKWD